MAENTVVAGDGLSPSMMTRRQAPAQGLHDLEDFTLAIGSSGVADDLPVGYGQAFERHAAISLRAIASPKSHASGSPRS